PNEVCDDGNNVSGDGCPADCTAHCGDNVLDPGEACDDGNTNDGDGCSADCTSTEASWSQVGATPSQRAFAGTAYDPFRRTVVMFGGCAVTLAGCVGDGLQDTWEWNGATWAERVETPSSAPPGRFATAMAYDVARRKLVLFGGCANTTGAFCNSALGDTWEW